MEKREEVIATNKIIFAVVFICAALITSLFVFNLSHRPKPLLSQDQGILFPEPREIKSFDLVATAGNAFTQTELRQHWTLLFFGFTHCSQICPATLDVLKRTYASLREAHPDLQVVFVSLDPERDKPAELSSYLHSFNKDFIGVSGKTDTLRKLQSQFGVYSEREDTATGKDYQLMHTANIFLINPNGKWAGMFNNGLKPQELIKAVEVGIG